MKVAAELCGVDLAREEKLEEGKGAPLPESNCRSRKSGNLSDQ